MCLPDQTSGCPVCRPLTIDFSSWKDRILEALGFLTWMEKLTSWVWIVFPNDILRQTFASHEKSSLILQTYVESEGTYQQSGFVGGEEISRAKCLYRS